MNELPLYISVPSNEMIKVFSIISLIIGILLAIVGINLFKKNKKTAGKILIVIGILAFIINIVQILFSLFL